MQSYRVHREFEPRVVEAKAGATDVHSICRVLFVSLIWTLVLEVIRLDSYCQETTTGTSTCFPIASRRQRRSIRPIPLPTKSRLTELLFSG